MMKYLNEKSLVLLIVPFPPHSVFVCPNKFHIRNSLHDVTYTFYFYLHADKIYACSEDQEEN